MKDFEIQQINNSPVNSLTPKNKPDLGTHQVGTQTLSIVALALVFGIVGGETK